MPKSDWLLIKYFIDIQQCAMHIINVQMESNSKINSVQKVFFSMDKFVTGPLMSIAATPPQQPPPLLQPPLQRKQQQALVLMECIA